jgi:hypothetical protein
MALALFMSKGEMLILNFCCSVFARIAEFVDVGVSERARLSNKVGKRLGRWLPRGRARART